MIGDIVRPGVVEVELGTPIADVLDRCGGPLPGRALRAAFSGISNPVLSADQLATPLSHEAMQAVGSGLGAAGFVIYDDTVCMVEVARSGYDDLSVNIADLIEGVDRAAARLMWSGVRRAGEPTERETLEIVRVDGGRAIEHWGGHS